ncbi:uncharacterized protein LOC143190916 isoform X3 [Rhynchophorus ferrugineus]|uniref:uncharacterized protein LOC143190916 isoform X3 n=1 Tax=Rhynchophorus ferrugineus TaxID=354439 RepID=UPI003FCCFA6E
MALNDSAAADILNKFSEMVQSYYEQLNTQKQLSLNEVNQLYSKLKNLEKVTVWEDEQENCIISDILMYIEIILTFVSNTSAFEFRQLKSFINIYLGALLEVLATASFRNKFIINCTDKVFNMFLYYKFNFVAVEGLLALFNEIASTVRLEVRKETGESLIHYVYQLIDTLILFGDYVIQSHVIETIFHIFGSFIMQSDLSYPLFPNDAELDASLKEVNCPKLYDEKVRLWLNKFNMRNPKILSLACQTILVGDYYCLPPKGFDTLWVDFNIEDKTVAFYCNSANDTVNRVYIVSKNVKNIHINRQLGKKEAILRLKLSKACITNVDQNIWDSMPKNIKIVIQNQEKEISNLIRTILPRLFKDVFSHVSPKISRSLKEVYKPLRIKQYRVSTVNHKSTGKSTSSNKKVSNNDADLNSSTEVHIPESQSSLKFSKPTDYITSPVSIEAHVAESQMNVKISKSRSDLVTSPISTSITELISESSTTRSIPDNRSDILSDNDEPTTTKDVIQDRSVSSSFKFVECSEEFQTAKDVCSLEFEETDGIVRRVQLTTSKLCSNVLDELTCNKSKPFSTNCSRVQVDVHIVDNGSVTPEKKISSESGQSSSLLEFLEQEDLKQQGKLNLLTNHSVTVTPENKVSSESCQSSSLLEFVDEQEDLEQGELKLLTNNNVTVTPEKKVSSDSGQSSSLLEFVQEQEDLEQPGNSNLLTSHSVTVTPEKKLRSEHGQSFSLLEFIEQENFKTPRKSKLLANQKIEKCFKNVKRRSKTLQKPKSSGDCNETESHGLNVINSESAVKGNATKNPLVEPTDECLEKRLQTSNNDPSRNNIEHVAVNISLESDIASVCYNPLNTNSVQSNQESNRQLINSGAARKYASTPRKETRPKESTLCSINISNIAADSVLIRNETQKYFPDRNNVIHSEDSTVSAGNTQTDFNLTDSDKTLIVGTDSTGDCVVGLEEKKNASKGRKQQNKQKKRKLPGSDQSLNVLKPVEDGVMPGDMKKRDDSQREKQHTERRRTKSPGSVESSNVFELLENDSKDVRPDENEKKHDSKRKKQTTDRKKRKLGSDVGLDGKVKIIDSKRKKQPIDKKKIKSPNAHPSWNVLKLLKDDVRLGEEKRNDSQRKKQPTEREKRILSGSDQSSNQCEPLDNDIVAEQNIQENSEREKTSEFQNEQSNRNFTSVGEDTDNNDSLILLEANMAEENTANLNVESCDTFTKIKNNKRNITTGKKQDEITESVMELCEDSTFKKRKNRTLFDPTDLSYLDRINLDETFMTTKTNIPNVPSSPKSKQTKNRTKATTTIKNRSIKKKTKPKKQPDTVESPYFNRRSKGHCADVSFRPRNLDWNELLNISRNLPNRNNSSGSRTEFPSLSFAHVRDDNDTCQLPMDSFTSSSLEEEPLNTESIVNEIDIAGIDKRANHTVFDHGPEEAQTEDVEITENETRFPQKTLNSKEVVKKLLQLAITCLDDDNNNNPELIAKIQALLE